MYISLYIYNNICPLPSINIYMHTISARSVQPFCLLYICLAINNSKFSRLVLEDIFIYVGIYTFIDVFSVIQGP